jgi:hypothetical protein
MAGVANNPLRTARGGPSQRVPLPGDLVINFVQMLAVLAVLLRLLAGS